MRSALRMRHYCDHCTKSLGTKPSMIKHESACTLNPSRVCNMCRIAGFEQQPVAVLLEAYGQGFLRLRGVAMDCPACVLATERQFWVGRGPDEGFGWDHPANTERNSWEFKEACKAFWAEYGGRNDDNYY